MNIINNDSYSLLQDLQFLYYKGLKKKFFRVTIVVLLKNREYECTNIEFFLKVGGKFKMVIVAGINFALLYRPIIPRKTVNVYCQTVIILRINSKKLLTSIIKKTKS